MIKIVTFCSPLTSKNGIVWCKNCILRGVEAMEWEMIDRSYIRRVGGGYWHRQVPRCETRLNSWFVSVILLFCWFGSLVLILIWYLFQSAPTATKIAVETAGEGVGCRWENSHVNLVVERVIYREMERIAFEGRWGMEIASQNKQTEKRRSTRIICRVDEREIEARE